MISMRKGKRWMPWEWEQSTSNMSSNSGAFTRGLAQLSDFSSSPTAIGQMLKTQKIGALLDAEKVEEDGGQERGEKKELHVNDKTEDQLHK